MWLASLRTRFSNFAHRDSPRDGGDVPSLFDGLQHVLRLVHEWPAGPSGDEMRRAACELVEADSISHQYRRRRLMLKTLAQMERRHADGKGRDGDPSPPMRKRLADALMYESGLGWTSDRP